MCALEFELPDENEMPTGGDFLSTPGTYHFQVTHTDEQPCKDSGEMIDGFQAEFTVLDGPRTGTACAEKGKKLRLTFYNPKLNAKDGGKWARIKQAAFLEATGLTDRSKRGQRVTINLGDAVDRQVIMEVEKNERDGEAKKYLQLAWANVYHIDDPRGKDCPKDAAAINLIPKSLRRDPASFKDGKGKDSTGASTNGGAVKHEKKAEKTAATAGAAAPAASSFSDDLGDL